MLNAQSAEQVTEIVKADGQEIDSETAERLFKEIEHHRPSDENLSVDELEAVSGGRDWITQGCAATVEPDSWCWTDDSCCSYSVVYNVHPCLMKQKLLKAQSAEHVKELAASDDKEIDDETAEKIFKEIEYHRPSDEKLSPDELEVVSGGRTIDYSKQGCAATVDWWKSWCFTNDVCIIVECHYNNIPNPVCPYCGITIENPHTCKWCGWEEQK